MHKPTSGFIRNTNAFSFLEWTPFSALLWDPLGQVLRGEGFELQFTLGWFLFVLLFCFVLFCFPMALGSFKPLCKYFERITLGIMLF